MADGARKDSSGGERRGAAVFELEGVAYAYPGTRRRALDGVGFRIDAGMTMVLGPNGAGKSTLAALLSGVRNPAEGTIRFRGVDLTDWKRSELARRLAVVAQEALSGIPMTAGDYVELGRNPWVAAWAPLGTRDAEVVSQALERTGTTPLASRAMDALSGGERQRVRLARALAQEPEVLLLDEPTAHLDFGHALWMFEELRSLVDERGWTVVCITHDLHLASRFGDRLVLLDRGRVRAIGAADEVLNAAILSDTYGCRVAVRRETGLGHLVVPVSVERTVAQRGAEPS